MDARTCFKKKMLWNCGCVRKMDRTETKYKKVIELFDGKIGEVIRVIHFHNSISFDEFIKGFKAMRYPGYSWRYRNKLGRKKNINNHLLIGWRKNEIPSQ